jgi:integrase
MEWSEVKTLDAKEPVWLLPPSRTKNGREHAIPLAPAVVSIIKTIPKIEDSKFVFTTNRTDGETSISGFSRAKATLDFKMIGIAREQAKARGDNPDKVAIAPWRLHDLRRTVASGLAGRGISVEVAEKVLNHVSGTFAGIVGVYQRHDFSKEKRHALTVWSDHIASLTTPRKLNVVRMKKA